MESVLKVNQIIDEIRQLSLTGKLLVLEKLVTLIKKQNHEKTGITEISGLGSEIWKKINIDDYVTEERKWD